VSSERASKGKGDRKHSARTRNARASFKKDIVADVETNIDDTTGEIIGRTIERLIDEGAYDAVATPYVGKKGRPGQTIRVICARSSVEKLARILVEETGTLGVKVSLYTRLIVPRKEISIPIVFGKFKGNVPVKVAKMGSMVRVKPEYSVLKQISDSERVPLRDVQQTITNTALRRLKTV
jgi:pyridinium-3,5-bisthiocarboxylic acid mononucleotide nickel chelatase